MKRMLMLTSVASMIDQFNMSNIEILRKQGYEVHVAANFEYGNTCSKQRIEEFKTELSELNVTYYQVDFSRKMTDIFTNIKVYKQIKNIILKNRYRFIHCQSPIGGVCGRIVAYDTKTPVIYTAHGFHFYKGAPLKNWLIYFPIEFCLARYTDVLITINKEDYERAQNFKAGRVEYIPGVGINTKKFNELNIDKVAKQKELELPQDAFVLLSVGELNKNKNHETVIKAISKLNNSNVYYVICGQGTLENYLKNLVNKSGLEKRVKFLGYRSDISEIIKASDVFVFPSLREGLSMSLMEAMASGLPVVCSNIRGNTDLIEDGKNGYIVKPHDIDGFVNAFLRLVNGNGIEMSEIVTQKIKNYDIEIVIGKMENIYKSQ